MTTDVQQPDNAAGKHKRLAVMQTLKEYASLSSLLRTLGAGVLIASVSMFLFKGWDSSGDIQRYLMLLAHTVVLALTGLLIGYWVGESKGARLFLCLSLIAAVVNFGVVGGLLYSQVQWDAGLSFYPGFARWQAGSLEAALAVAAAGWALLVPVAWISFMALARRSAWRMTSLFMLSGAALLLPVREAGYVAVVVGAVTCLLLFQMFRAAREDRTLATPEGRFARLVTFSLPMVMVGRGMYLYGPDAVMITVVSALVFLVLRQIATDAEAGNRTRVVVNRLSLLPVLTAAAGATGVLEVNHLLPDALLFPAFAAVVAGMALEISMRSPAGGAGYRRIAGVFASLCTLVNLWLFPGVDTALISTAAGLLIAVLGHAGKHREVFATGLVAFLSGVAWQCYAAFRVFDLGSWTTLAVMGIVAIVAGSLLERYGTIVSARLANWRESLRS